MEIKIERLAFSDWKKFYRCFKGVLEEEFGTYPPRARESFSDEVKLKRAFREGKKPFFIAKKDNKMVGFLIAVGSSSGVSFINWLGVTKQFRRQGIGRKLIQVWQSWAKKRGYHKLRASTTNQGNRPFYEKLGFSLEGTKKKDRYGLDHFIFGKVIGELK